MHIEGHQGLAVQDQEAGFQGRILEVRKHACTWYISSFVLLQSVLACCCSDIVPHFVSAENPIEPELLF